MKLFPVAILAGGLATRLRPHTESLPKSLIEVAGRPFIFHQLRWLKHQGIEDVVLCVGYLGHLIENVVKDGSKWGLSVRYSYDPPTLLGTGGALKYAMPHLAKNFFVLYGDSLLSCSLSEIQAKFVASEKPCLMTVFPNGNAWDNSNVLFQHGQLIEYNKTSPTLSMKHIDYGLSLMSEHVLEPYPKNVPLDLATVYHGLSLQGLMVGFEVQERFYEMGSFQGLKDMEHYLSHKDAYPHHASPYPTLSQ